MRFLSLGVLCTSVLVEHVVNAWDSSEWCIEQGHTRKLERAKLLEEVMNDESDLNSFGRIKERTLNTTTVRNSNEAYKNLRGTQQEQRELGATNGIFTFQLKVRAFFSS